MKSFKTFRESDNSIGPVSKVPVKKKNTCANFFNCCDCGGDESGRSCGCPGCRSCNSCDQCKAGNDDKCENTHLNENRGDFGGPTPKVPMNAHFDTLHPLTQELIRNIPHIQWSDKLMNRVDSLRKAKNIETWQDVYKHFPNKEDFQKQITPHLLEDIDQAPLGNRTLTNHFNKLDTVRVSKGPLAGKTGTIQQDSTTHGFYRVKMDGGQHSAIFHSSELDYHGQA